MKVLYLLFAVALLSASLYLFQHRRHNHVELHGIPKKVYEEYLLWKIQFNKDYSKDVEIEKIKIFYDNWNFIQSHDPSVGYTVAANQFMDMNKEEFRRTMLTAVPIDQSELKGVKYVDETAQAPASVNWVTAGKVSPVKNQGQCGSCWAFSCTGANESDDAITSGTVGDFSEQQLVDCSQMYGNMGCNGGNYFWANKYVMKYGITTEQAYPYTGVNGKCKTEGGAWKISSQTMVTPNSCTGLTNAIATQPTSVQVDASNWQFYSSGIFKNCGTSIDHDVLAVGYTSTYWYVKNSWGVSWGMQGFIDLAPGNTCAICSQGGYPNK